VARAVRRWCSAGSPTTRRPATTPSRTIKRPFAPPPATRTTISSRPADNLDGMLVAPGRHPRLHPAMDGPLRASTNDYDLEVSIENAQSPRLVSTSTNRQTGTQTRSRRWRSSIPCGNRGPRRRDQEGERHGPAPRTLLPDLRQFRPRSSVMPAGSIFGHAAVDTVVAVGAIDTWNDPGLDRSSLQLARAGRDLPSPLPRRAGSPTSWGSTTCRRACPVSRASPAPRPPRLTRRRWRRSCSQDGCRRRRRFRRRFRATAVDIAAPASTPWREPAGWRRSPPSGPCRPRAAPRIRSATTATRARPTRVGGCVCVHEPNSCDDGNPCTTARLVSRLEDASTGRQPMAPRARTATCATGRRRASAASAPPATPLACTAAPRARRRSATAASGCSIRRSKARGGGVPLQAGSRDGWLRDVLAGGHGQAVPDGLPPGGACRGVREASSARAVWLAARSGNSRRPCRSITRAFRTGRALRRLRCLDRRSRRGCPGSHHAPRRDPLTDGDA